MLQLCEEAVKNGEKGPAVLALPEQESSPPSLQPLESVSELSRCKLYPELPKTAPEMQVMPINQEYEYICVFEGFQSPSPFLPLETLTFKSQCGYYFTLSVSKRLYQLWQK